MLQTFTFTGGGRLVNAAATFFRYESGSAQGADDSIRVRADGQDLGLYRPGDAIRLPNLAKTWELTPVSGFTSGVVRLGVGEVQSARLVGTVQVIDSVRVNVMADREVVSSINVTSAAGLYSTGEIWNGTTDKGIAVRGFSVMSDIAQSVAVSGVNVELVPTVTTTTNTKRITAGGGNGPANIRRNSRNTSAASDNSGQSIAFWGMAAGVRQEFMMYGAPIVIGPGSGLRLSAMNPQSTLSILLGAEVFDW